MKPYVKKIAGKVMKTLLPKEQTWGRSKQCAEMKVLVYLRKLILHTQRAF